MFVNKMENSSVEEEIHTKANPGCTLKTHPIIQRNRNNDFPEELMVFHCVVLAVGIIQYLCVMYCFCYLEVLIVETRV